MVGVARAEVVAEGEGLIKEGRGGNEITVASWLFGSHQMVLMCLMRGGEEGDSRPPLGGVSLLEVVV